MTKAVIEPAVSSGKPKRLLDQIRYIARESLDEVLAVALEKDGALAASTSESGSV